MKNRRFIMSRLTMSLLLVLLPAAANAQVGGGPFAGLFGRFPQRAGQDWTALDFRAAVGGEYDSSLFLDAPTAGDGPPTGVDDTIGSGIHASLTFNRHTGVSDVVFAGDATYQEYFARPRSFGATSGNAEALYRIEATTRLRFDATAIFRHQPYFQLLPPSLTQLPDWILPVPASPYAALMSTNDSIEGDAGIHYQTSKRSEIEATISAQRSKFYTGADYESISRGAQGRWSYRLSRDFRMLFGYRQQRYQITGVKREEFTDESIAAGVDFAREISLARRTSLSFSADTTVLREGNAAPGHDAQNVFRVNGAVALVKGFQRTWHVSLTGARRTEIYPGFFQPVFTDSVSAAVGGMLAERLSWSALATASQGTLAFESSGPGFTSVTAASRLTVALTRKLGCYVQYALFNYGAPARSLPAIMPITDTTRNSVAVGLNVWVPIFSSIRTPSGPQ